MVRLKVRAPAAWTPKFTTRSGLVQKDALFAPEQLAEIYHALRFTREQDESLSIGQDRELKNIMTQIEQLVPENDLHRQESPEQSGMTMK